jgi:2-polyprenyl-3-methyl-5-hydroxy-6-metoxy-1,4-benzoquinol methylase
MIYTPFREKDASYYDRIYESGYSTQAYRPIYEAVLDFLGRMDQPRVLEVGCGTGDLARQIVQQNIHYRGFDISSVAIARCRAMGISGITVGSAYEPANYMPHDFNVVVALEVFEHIDDREAIGHFPDGTHVLFSVPNFVETSHLRAYQDPPNDIVEYYRGLLTVGQVLPFQFVSPDGQILTIFLVHATVGAGPCANPLAK